MLLLNTARYTLHDPRLLVALVALAIGASLLISSWVLSR
jgi:hypothetical protein